jgi:glycosyltransferase involved in cell wall biosynthesis
VKDADLSVRAVIKNCLPIVDWLLVLDNDSTDDTPEEITKMMSMSDKILSKRILTVNSGGRYLNALCGTDTIVLKIDADEFWNPTHARQIREALLTVDLAGFAFGSIAILEVNGIDLSNSVCAGKLSAQKPYYFGNIMAWSQTSERLHGEPMTLRKGCDSSQCFRIVGYHPGTAAAVPSMLHFPFLDMCSLTREDMSPMGEVHKASYVEKNPDAREVCELGDYGIEDVLKNILRGETAWTVGETHPHLV